MNQMQTKHLQGRIEAAASKLYSKAGRPALKPAKVLAAEKVVDAYNKERNKAADKARESYRAQVRAAKEAVLFKSIDDALKAVEQLERDAA